MGYFEYGADRQIISSDLNEYAEGDRDETLWDSDLTDDERAWDDLIPDGVNEERRYPHPVYEEEGFRY